MEHARVDTRSVVRVVAEVVLAVAFLGCSAEPSSAAAGGAAAGSDSAGGGAPIADSAQGDVKVDSSCATSAACAAHAAGPWCNPQTHLCEAKPPGHQIGLGDRSPGSVTITTLFKPKKPFEATDLQFHPERFELWVVNRPFEVKGLCTELNPASARCGSLIGTTTILFDPGLPSQQAEIRTDENAWHFMRRPPAMAMGVQERWATCGEARTGNFEDDIADFMGPTLWSSDLAVFAVHDVNNGSHMDMLHETPLCMGIAHERDNVYWTFNGQVGAIDRYDFSADHGPGMHDHSDGSVNRYVKGQLARVPGVPSHMEFRKEDGQLYIADTGHGRIVKLDTASGVPGGGLAPVYEPLADAGTVKDAVLTEFLAPGTLDQPSGLALHGDVLFVSDHASSWIFAFALDGTLLRALDTGMPPGTLAGITFGPDDRLYFADMLTGSVHRIDP